MSNQKLNLKPALMAVSFSIPAFFGAFAAQAGAEYQTQLKQFQQMDENNDGLLSKDELSDEFKAKIEPVGMQHIDRDGDDMLDLPEFTAALETVQSTGQAAAKNTTDNEGEVVIEQAEPEVTVSQADPEVTIEQQEPQVEVQNAEQAAVITDSEETRQMAQSGASSLDNLKVSELIDREVYNSNGEEIGDIEALVKSLQGDKVAAVVGIGGMLGMGEKEIAVDLDELQLQGERLTMSTVSTADELERRTEYDADLYREIESADMTIAEISSGADAQTDMAKSTAGTQHDFQALDDDANGYLSREETSDNDKLDARFSELDENSDSQLDRAEFSAFEVESKPEQ